MESVDGVMAVSKELACDGFVDLKIIKILDEDVLLIIVKNQYTLEEVLDYNYGFMYIVDDRYVYDVFNTKDRIILIDNTLLIHESEINDLPELIARPSLINSLATLCISILESPDISALRLKKKEMSPEILDNCGLISHIEHVNDILSEYYDCHTTVMRSEDGKRTFDPKPIISFGKHNRSVTIKVFEIIDANNDYVSGDDKTMKRYIKNIVRSVRRAIRKCKKGGNITIDLTDCGGGSFPVFLDCFSDLIGRGKILDYVMPNGETVAEYYHGNGDSDIARTTKGEKITIGKNVKVVVSNRTCSSGEFLAMIIHAKYFGAVIEFEEGSEETAGYLSKPKYCEFMFKMCHMLLRYAISNRIVDTEGRIFNGCISKSII